MDSFLIVGLGNPGLNYRQTRHNIGQTFLYWLKETINNADFILNKKCSALVFKTDFMIIKKKKERNIRLIIALPQVFMNQSGNVVKNLVHYYQIDPKQLFIVHDDNDLKIGQFKITFNQKSAGHKGVESIIQKLATQKFHRIKIGIQPLQINNRIKAEKIVLKKITLEEQNLMNDIFPKIKQSFENSLRQILN